MLPRGWRDPRCGRELLIRGGITTVMAAVIYGTLQREPLIWLAPVVVMALVLVRWALWAGDDEEATGAAGDDERPDA